MFDVGSGCFVGSEDIMQERFNTEMSLLQLDYPHLCIT